MKKVLASNNNLEEELTISGKLYKDQYDYLKKQLAYHEKKVASRP